MLYKTLVFIFNVFLDLKSLKVKQTYSEHRCTVSVVKISSRSHSIAASGDKSGGIVSYNIAR